ncbi:MAG TPA: iron-sulfur cluster assembly accessory protein, partial [Fimbriimonadaceae bacterium]|nr:iron-sulfur cluster assembly accessory protein [Fimbriimonadaceae bacterium]
MSQFPVVVDDSAFTQLSKLVAKDGREGVFLRVGVKGGGCSGLEYVLKLDTTRREHDLVWEHDGVTVVCDAKSAVYLAGATLVY